MIKLLRKIFVPHESNGFHPHSTRHYSLLAYALLFVVCNYVFFPLLGISNNRVYAQSINIDSLINLANKERASKGLTPVRKNETLTKAAQLKGNDMFAKQYWSHFGPNGESPWQFITDSGYQYIYAGENLAKDFYQDFDAHNAWMNSPTHRDNILNPQFDDIGIAVVKGQFQGKETTIIVEMFGNKYDANLDNFVTKEEFKAPTITKPGDETVLNQNNITIEGQSDSGDTLKVFSNGKLIGELPKGNNSFTINLNLLEKQNELFLRSKDSQSGKESQDSNKIKVEIDNEAPDLNKIKVEIFKTFEETYVIATSTENLSKISYKALQLSGDMTIDGDKFISKFSKENTPTQVILTFYDLAGNHSEKVVILGDETLQVKDEGLVLGTTNFPTTPTSQKGILHTISEAQRLNILFLLGIGVIFAIDLLVLYKRRIKRHHSSYLSFHLAIFMITTFAVVL